MSLLCHISKHTTSLSVSTCSVYSQEPPQIAGETPLTPVPPPGPGTRHFPHSCACLSFRKSRHGWLGCVRDPGVCSIPGLHGGLPGRGEACCVSGDTYCCQDNSGLPRNSSGSCVYRLYSGNEAENTHQAAGCRLSGSWGLPTGSGVSPFIPNMVRLHYCFLWIWLIFL